MTNSQHSYNEAQSIIDATMEDGCSTPEMRNLGFLAKLCVTASENCKRPSFVIFACNKFYADYFQESTYSDRTGIAKALYYRVAEIFAPSQIKHFQE